MKKITEFMKTEAFLYLVFGVLTTLVYYIFMYGSLKMLTGNANAAAISEFIGQAISIIFAFITNKIWVFRHKSSNLLVDFVKFAGGRIFFMVLAIALKWWFGDVHPTTLPKLFHINFDDSMLVFSLFIQILNIVLNYFYSKFLVFRHKKEA